MALVARFAQGPPPPIAGMAATGRGGAAAAAPPRQPLSYAQARLNSSSKAATIAWLSSSPHQRHDDSASVAIELRGLNNDDERN
jgi:hypothetical protein